MQLKQVLRDLLREDSPHNNFTILDTAKRIYGQFDEGKIRSALSDANPVDRNDLIKTTGLDERERVFTAVHESLFPKPVVKEEPAPKATKKKIDA